MSRDEDKLIRQLSLLSFLLSRPRPFSAREIQESVEGYYGMNDETFARRFYGDRADLAKIGIEVRALGPTEGTDFQMYRLLEEDYCLPDLELTATERHTLALALATLDGRFAYARPLRLALAAIFSGHPDPLHDELEQVPVALAADEDLHRAGKQLARLEQAVTRGKSIRFSYPSSSGASEQRTFDPYSLFLIQGRWYTVGFDHARQAIRTFRVARIEGAIRFLTERSRDFSIPDDYDPTAYRARPPWLIGRVCGTAVIRVDEHLSWWASRLEPHIRRVGEDEQECTVFAAPYADEEVLLSWIVGLGDCAELLQPGELRDRLRRRLEKLRAAHEGAPSAAPPVVTPPAGPTGRAPRSLPAGAGAIAPEHLASVLALLQYLVADNQPAVISWADLQDDLGLSRTEIENDLSILNLMNFGGGSYALTAEADDRGVHVTRDVMADTFVRPARLSPLMARSLLLAIDLLGGTIDLQGVESLSSVRAKIAALVGDSATDFLMVDDVMPPAPDVMAALSDGIRNNRIVTIDYFTPTRSELASRLIEPYLLFRSRDGWYVEAYCLKADAQRTFKLELIRSARTTEKVFTRRPGVDLSSRLAGMPLSPAPSASWASIRFLPRWRAHLEDRGLAVETLADGTLATRMPYLDERWMAREVLRFLGEAVLDDPGSVRAAVHDLAVALLEHYAHPPIGSAGARTL
ncbi:MAG: helix-turn-helix transcriptional regulator [Thermoleophilia bacterium]|jgi:predicted DNA-binding transcriptional regulator YafY